MPYEALFENETERALEYRAANPRAEAPKPSAWAQLGEVLKAVPKGVAQGVMQSARNMQSGPVAGNPLTMTAIEQDEMVKDSGMTAQSIDRDLRRGIERLKPDPVTSTLASQVVQDGVRVLTKVGMYAAAGRSVGAIVGTGVDEGMTGRTELIDQGVDPGTATKVGAVRGAAMAAGVALPAVGSTLWRTLGLAAVGGPGSYVAEQTATRAILESAEYPDIARQYDPWDPAGLGISLLVPGVVGLAVHRARAKAGKNGAAATMDSAQVATESIAPAGPAVKHPELTEALRSMPELQDAALVVHKSHVTDAHILGDVNDLAARQSHVSAYEAAARAMDEGQPVHVTDLEFNPAKAQEVMQGVQERMRATEAQLAPLREMMDLPDEPNPTARIRAVDDGAQLAAPASLPPGPEARPLEVPKSPNAAPAALLDSLDPEVRKVVQPIADLVGLKQAEAPAPKDTPMARAQRIADSRPELQVEFDGEKTSAAQLVERVAEESATTRREASAFRAAVECFLKG